MLAKQISCLMLDCYCWNVVYCIDDWPEAHSKWIVVFCVGEFCSIVNIASQQELSAIVSQQTFMDGGMIHDENLRHQAALYCEGQLLFMQIHTFSRARLSVLLIYKFMITSISLHCKTTIPDKNRIGIPCFMDGDLTSPLPGGLTIMQLET